MKCFTPGLLVLLFSCAVQAATTGNTSPNPADDDSKKNSQVFLPSGPGVLTVDVSDDNKVSKQTSNTKEPVKVELSVKPITEKSAKPEKNKSAESAKEKWGVDNFKVRLTAAGYMLDVRYRVIDKIKAKPLFSRKLRPFAIEEGSGVKYGVPASPKVGFLRQAPQFVKENKEYFLMIANPGNRIKAGDKLTLIIGDFRIEHLTVE